MLFLIMAILIAYAACNNAVKVISQTGKTTPWILVIQFWSFAVIVSALAIIHVDTGLAIVLSLLASWDIALWVSATALITPFQSKNQEEMEGTWRVGEKTGELANEELLRFWWYLLYENRTSSHYIEGRAMMLQIFEGTAEIDQIKPFLGIGVRIIQTEEDGLFTIMLLVEKNKITLTKQPDGRIKFGWALRYDPGNETYLEKYKELINAADARSP